MTGWADPFPPSRDGISGPITFNEVGDPTEASIGVYVYGADNTYTAYNG